MTIKMKICQFIMMMEKIENFDSLNDFLSQINDNVSIISGNIPVEIQMQYYKLLEQIYGKSDKTQVANNAQKLFSKDVDIEEKKKILVSLALFDDVNFFRIIEKYYKSPNKELKQWALMAYHHAKVNLENSFLSEKKILISTGLGGKNNKLRYFVVLLADNQDIAFTETQKKVIKNEIEIVFNENNIDLETLTFYDNYLTLKLLLSFKVPVQNIFQQIIKNCNDLGQFMSEHFIVTNVKELTSTEIRNIISKEEGN